MLPPIFNFLGKPLLGEKYVHGKKKKERRRRIMPSLVATTSTLARTKCVRTHFVRTNSLEIGPPLSSLASLTIDILLPSQISFSKTTKYQMINHVA